MLNKEPDRFMALLQASENLLGKLQIHDNEIQDTKKDYP